VPCYTVHTVDSMRWVMSGTTLSRLDGAYGLVIRGGSALLDPPYRTADGFGCRVEHARRFHGRGQPLNR